MPVGGGNITVLGKSFGMSLLSLEAQISVSTPQAGIIFVPASVLRLGSPTSLTVHLPAGVGQNITVSLIRMEENTAIKWKSPFVAYFDYVAPTITSITLSVSNPSTLGTHLCEKLLFLILTVHEHRCQAGTR